MSWLVMMWTVGCGGDAPGPRAPAAASGRGAPRIQIPDHALAVMEVELAPVRRSPLWHLVQRLVASQSQLAAGCPAVLDLAERVTLGVQVDKDGDAKTVFAIVRGIDRAAIAACLRAPAPPAVATAAVATASRPASCRRFDDAVDEVARCDQIPRTLAGTIEPAQLALAGAPAETRDAACTRALAVVDKINARRNELGWPCDPDVASRRTSRFSRVVPLDADTVVLDDRELVHFADAATAVIVQQNDDRHRDRSPQALRGELQRMIGGPTARWYDSARATRDPTRPVWIAIDLSVIGPRREVSRHGEQITFNEPPRIVGSIDVERDVNLDLTLSGVSFADLDNYPKMVAGLLEDPMFHGISVATSCGGSQLDDARTARCRTAFARIDELHARAPSRTVEPDAALLEPWWDDLSLSRCVSRPWPDGYLACVRAANDVPALERCSEKLGVEQFDFFQTAVCRGGGARVRIGIPLLKVESYKLFEIQHRKPRRDCREDGEAPPPAVVVGAGRSFLGEAVPALAAFVCGSGGVCRAIDLATPYTRSSDSRWHDFESPARERCVGPFNGVPNNGTQGDNRIASTCDDTTAGMDARPAKLTLCRGTATVDCTTIPLPPTAPRPKSARPLPAGQPRTAAREVSINPGALRAAIVVGAPGAQSIEVWDLFAHRRLGQLAAGTTNEQPCARVQLLGERVLVATGACDDGEARERIQPVGAFFAALDGKRIATIGGDRPLAILRAPPIWLSGSRWAFVAGAGDSVVIQDVKTGAVERRIATGEPVEPGLVTAGGDDAGHLALVYGGKTSRVGSVTSIDTATGSVLHIPSLPRCPSGGDE
jgi:hypothetical protein